MFQNRFERENEIKDILISLFRNGAIRSTGEDIIEILVDQDSVALFVNTNKIKQIAQEINSATPPEEVFNSNARMR